jgi:hypothetical protein
MCVRARKFWSNLFLKGCVLVQPFFKRLFLQCRFFSPESLREFSPEEFPEKVDEVELLGVQDPCGQFGDALGAFNVFFALEQ